MFAVFQTGAKQHKVTKGDVIDVEKLEGEEGKTIKFTNVLLTSDAGKTNVGAPLVSGAVVTAKVVAQKRGEKIKVYKMKAKKRYQKTQGHRQFLTTLEITDISAGSAKAPAAKKEEKAETPKVEKVEKTEEKEA